VVKKIIGKVSIEAPVLVEVIDPAFRINNGSLQPSLKVCAAPGSGVIQLGSCNVDVLKCIGGKRIGAGVNARHSEIISGHLLHPVLLISGIVSFGADLGSFLLQLMFELQVHGYIGKVLLQTAGGQEIGIQVSLRVHSSGHYLIFEGLSGREDSTGGEAQRIPV